MPPTYNLLRLLKSYLPMLAIGANPWLSGPVCWIIPCNLLSDSLYQEMLECLLWTPPQAEFRQETVISARLATMLANVMRDGSLREEMAGIFTRCAEEGAQEIYRSLIPLLKIEGIEEFL